MHRVVVLLVAAHRAKDEADHEDDERKQDQEPAQRTHLERPAAGSGVTGTGRRITTLGHARQQVEPADEHELAKGQALVEHAGAVNDATLAGIAAALTRKYRRPVTASAKANPALLAGLRVKVGDDVYESSVAGQLAALSTAV